MSKIDEICATYQQAFAASHGISHAERERDGMSAVFRKHVQGMIAEAAWWGRSYTRYEEERCKIYAARIIKEALET